MAKQQKDPPPWLDSMSDGCTGVLDKLPGANMKGPCTKHDKKYYYGGEDPALKVMADAEFHDDIRDLGCLLCRLYAAIRWWGVDRFADDAWNWEGPGMPEDFKDYSE